MKKVVLLIFLTLQLQSCIEPGIYSVVDNTLFSQPYKAPIFYIMFSGKREQKIAEEVEKNLNKSFEASRMAPYVILINLNEMNESQINSMMIKTYEDKTSDIVFTFKLTQINIYESYGMTSITDFSYLVTAFDYKINKEVWKSKVYSPWHGNSVNNMTTEFVDKLINDKVL